MLKFIARIIPLFSETVVIVSVACLYFYAIVVNGVIVVVTNDNALTTFTFCR